MKMKKIAHVRESIGLNLPQEIIDVVVNVVTVLDTEYGDDRDVDCGDGGYVMIIETEGELEGLKEIHLDVKTAVPEYTERIQCNDGKIFISTLVLLSSDFGILVVMPMQFLVYTNWAVYL